MRGRSVNTELRVPLCLLCAPCVPELGPGSQWGRGDCGSAFERLKRGLLPLKLCSSGPLSGVGLPASLINMPAPGEVLIHIS